MSQTETVQRLSLFEMVQKADNTLHDLIRELSELSDILFDKEAA